MGTIKEKIFFNVTRGSLLSRQTLIANKFCLRLRGLLFRPRLAHDNGLYLEPCRSIHMFGMAYPIDAVFMDRLGTVVGLVEGIQPGSISKYYPLAHACLELPVGTIIRTATQLGDKIECPGII